MRESQLFLVCVVVSLLLVSCGDGTDSGTTPKNTSVQETKVTYTVSFDLNIP